MPSSEGSDDTGGAAAPLARNQVCRGTTTDGGLPCRCPDDCHTCILTEGGAGRDGHCSVCKNSKALLGGKCVHTEECPGGKEGTVGKGNFGRKCKSLDETTDAPTVQERLHTSHIYHLNSLLTACDEGPIAVSKMQVLVSPAETFVGLKEVGALDATDSLSQCADTASALNNVIKKYTMGTQTGTLSCSLNGFLVATHNCSATIDTINSAAFAYQVGNFDACIHTTATTSQTSTVTSSATTTPTSTAVYGKTSCLDRGGFTYLKVDGDSSVCSQQALHADALLNECAVVGGVDNGRNAAPLRCTAAAGAHLLQSDNDGCMKAAALMNDMLAAFAAHGGYVGGSVSCSPGGVFLVTGDCFALSSTFNAALTAYVDGSFNSCRRTTQTTTETTTPTTTTTTTTSATIPPTTVMHTTPLPGLDLSDDDDDDVVSDENGDDDGEVLIIDGTIAVLETNTMAGIGWSTNRVTMAAIVAFASFVVLIGAVMLRRRIVHKKQGHLDMTIDQNVDLSPQRQARENESGMHMTNFEIDAIEDREITTWDNFMGATSTDDVGNMPGDASANESALDTSNFIFGEPAMAISRQAPKYETVFNQNGVAVGRRLSGFMEDDDYDDVVKEDHDERRGSGESVGSNHTRRKMSTTEIKSEKPNHMKSRVYITNNSHGSFASSSRSAHRNANGKSVNKSLGGFGLDNVQPGDWEDRFRGASTTSLLPDKLVSPENNAAANNFTSSGGGGGGGDASASNQVVSTFDTSSKLLDMQHTGPSRASTPEPPTCTTPKQSDRAPIMMTQFKTPSGTSVHESITPNNTPLKPQQVPVMGALGVGSAQNPAILTTDVDRIAPRTSFPTPTRASTMPAELERSSGAASSAPPPPPPPPAGPASSFRPPAVPTEALAPTAGVSKKTPVTAGVEDDPDPFGGYKIEEVLGTRHVAATGAQEFQVKWHGYGPEHNSWEAAVDMMGSPKLKEFQQRQEVKRSLLHKPFGRTKLNTSSSSDAFCETST